MEDICQLKETHRRSALGQIVLQSHHKTGSNGRAHNVEILGKRVHHGDTIFL